MITSARGPKQMLYNELQSGDHASKTLKQGIKKALKHRRAKGRRQQGGHWGWCLARHSAPGLTQPTRGQMPSPRARGKHGVPSSRWDWNREGQGWGAGGAAAGGQQHQVAWAHLDMDTPAGVESPPHWLWENQQVDQTSPVDLGTPDRRVRKESGQMGRLLRSRNSEIPKCKEPRSLRSRAHCRALQKQLLTHRQAESGGSPTSEGIAVSLPRPYYSYTVRPTPKKYLGGWVTVFVIAQTDRDFKKGKIGIPIQVLSLTSYVTSDKSKILLTSSSNVICQW